MLSLRLHPGGGLALHQEPVPTPGPGEALVRVTAVGLCGSDRHWLVDGGTGDAALDAPLVLGHEAAGVPETGAYRDRLVAVDPAIPCGTCEWCASGASNVCRAMRFAGSAGTDGALREWIAWPERCLHPLADGIDDAVGALVEPLAVAIHAADLAGTLSGASVAVVGCGPIGLLLVALARAAGASAIVASDPHAHRLDAATALGATMTLPAASAPADGERMVAATGGRGFDVAFDAAGEASAVETTVEIARPAGQVILVGIPPDDRTTFRASTARRKGLTIRLVRRSTEDSFRRAVAEADRGAAYLEGLVTLRAPLREGPEAFSALIEQRGIKVVVEPSAGRPSDRSAGGAPT